MKKPFLLTAGACVALAVPAAALAATSAPKLPSDVIVPNVSLGGLKLNAPASTAKKVFPAKDCTAGGCQYQAPDGSWSLQVLFAAKTKTSTPYIGLIGVDVSVTAKGAPSLQTSSGISFGSSPAELKKAYPHLLGSANRGFSTASGTKVPATTYTFDGSKLYEIAMRSVNFG